MEAASPEDKITSMVHTFANTAVEKLVIEHINREIIWWTSWAIGIVLILFIHHLLAEDKINEEAIRQRRDMKDVCRSGEEEGEDTERDLGEVVHGWQTENGFDEVFDDVGPIKR
ncbi:hypothetical protein F4679DRAFT_581103 [Xylaria curta]|nr:hypothetical protein F4679DRAFT_581103 [Xylaria curta]